MYLHAGIRKATLGMFAITSFLLAGAKLPSAQTPAGGDKKPNILVIMGDDIGMWNIGAYHRGLMAGKTPNLDKLAKEGMLFTDYYAEASCTAGRANFISGELPIRTGMTTVGQAGAAVGLPAEAVTIATVLKSMGYATGQFGKNHLGDKNEFLPTVHGFDEFFGYLYHLDAMEDPAHPNYPQNLLNIVGPRNMVHSWAADTDDQTDMPRWGKVGKQKIEDAGPLYPKRMETVDDEIRDFAVSFIDKAKKDNKPFFVWLNPTRMHIVTHLSPKYAALRNAENGWSEEEAGMAQLDDDIGMVMKKLKDIGEDENTIVLFTTDNGTEVFTWPDGGQTPFAQSKGTVLEGGFRVPAILRWPGHVPADSVQNGIFSGLDWFPTFVAAAGNPNIVDELLKGKTIGDRTYKNHLDGYNQLAAITGKGLSARAMKSSTSARARSVRCASTITNSASSTNLPAGSAKKPILTSLTSPICGSIHSSAPVGPTTEQKREDSNISIGSNTNSGASFSSSSWWQRKSKPSLSTRRCSAARASTLMQSKRRWGKGWLRRRRRPKAPAVDRNDLQGGRPSKHRPPDFPVAWVLEYD
jgi:arylsulfatase A-like enzyme